MKTFCKFLFCLVLVLLSFSNTADAKSVQARVIEAINCFSLKVLTDGEPQVVRLAEVTSPQAHFNSSVCEDEAKYFLQEMTSGQDVSLLFWAIDSSGRSVCEVFLQDGTSLGALMVSKGYLLQDQYYSESARLRSLEQTAKMSRLGIWKHAGNYTSAAAAKSSFEKW